MVIGEHRDEVVVSEIQIDLNALGSAVLDPTAGGVVTFLGTVRNHSPGKAGVTHLVYEAYNEVVEEKILEIVAEARQKWDLVAVRVSHRLGHVEVGETSVGVAVSAAHRVEAFEAARYLIDELKRRAPIWKQEHWSGGEEWIEGA